MDVIVLIYVYRNKKFLYHAAPAQPPLNVEWTLIGSQLSLYWEPVVAMESESEVTGYQVSSTFSACLAVTCLFLNENADLTFQLSGCTICIFTIRHPPCVSPLPSCHTEDKDTKR